MISGKNAIAVLLAAGLALTLAACGESETSETSASGTEPAETVSASESAEPSEETEEMVTGVWATEDESVQAVVEGDRISIERNTDDGENETYWVGSFEENESGWTSVRDPDEEMTADCDTIEFTWEGTDNVYDKLSYAVTNEDGTKTTVTMDRILSAADIYTGPGPAIVDEEDETEDTSAADTGGTDSSSGDTAAVPADASGSTAAGKASSAPANNDTAAADNAASGGTATYAAKASENTGTASSGNTASSDAGSSSGTAAAACAHNYQGSVKTAATCSSTGTMIYTCTKCGDSYETTIPATGNHNWQTIYKTVHHDAVGHYETVTVQDAVYEYRDVCNKCGYVASTTGTAGAEEVYRHIRNEHDNVASYSNKKVCIQEAVTEQQWVVDTPAYDEQVADYQRCSVCGATT
ncbi:MAG: hypothetical protein LUD72_01410 [Bacteroidales bacterium]|nr:hypothetical protein [Bacteroidales bacterium]